MGANAISTMSYGAHSFDGLCKSYRPTSNSVRQPAQLHVQPITSSVIDSHKTVQ